MSNPTPVVIPAVPIIIPMPVPGAADALKFNGWDVNRFLKRVLFHGRKANINDEDQLVNYLLEYCNRTRYEDLCYDPAFQAGKANRTWALATDCLRLLYLALNEPEEVTTDDLKEYCQKSFFSGTFETRTDIHNYTIGYCRIANALFNSQEITELSMKQTFLTGLPKHLAMFITEKVPEVNQKRKNPPTIEEVVMILYDRLRKEALDWNPYEYAKRRSTKSSKVHFNDKDLGSDDNTETDTKPAVTPKSTNTGKKVTPTNEPTISEHDKYKALIRKMNEMSIALANTNRRPPSPRCAETGKLVCEGILVQDQNGRYTLLNGMELLRWDGFTPGGLAEMLRAEQLGTNTRRNARDAPPHQVNMAMTNAITLSYGYRWQNGVLDGNVFTVSPYYEDEYKYDKEAAYYENVYNTDAATRSNRNNNNRYDPADQTGRHNRVERAPQKPSQPPPSQHQQCMPAPPNPSMSKIPPPPNPINRKEGWKDSLPLKNSDNYQSSKPPNQQQQTLPSGTHYHYTSDIQERTDPSKIMNQLLQTKVEITMGELIGVSQPLQKLVSDMACMKRAYTNGKEGKTSSAVAEVYDTMQMSSIAENLEVEVSDQREFNNFLVRYSNSVTQMPDKQYFTMTTGIMEIKLGGVSFRAMIDSGSELNIVSFFVPEHARLVLDTLGMKWSLKGINGDAEPLRGVILDAPIQLGSHNFPHHLFVSSHKVSNNFNIILGQPFLQWYASRLDYWHEGHVKLFLWKDANKRKIPHVSISLTDPKDRQNTQMMHREPEDGNDRPIGFLKVEDVTEENFFEGNERRIPSRDFW
ncbi:hypothetical protein BT96DRAFT_943997 [Gymnopus androsaceus JB14]|uniref:DUF4100 domain-containing protein n=1 Tax=Gymnopus androsaceus JB14 TaxID=1447944 RepID=A0A6A4H5B5_9AGAR|nr:hypothetical protein BT96DRAFT_943997 [Gymnopus androsaceus JB14]